MIDPLDVTTLMLCARRPRPGQATVIMTVTLLALAAARAGAPLVIAVLVGASACGLTMVQVDGRGPGQWTHTLCRRGPVFVRRFGSRQVAGVRERRQRRRAYAPHNRVTGVAPRPIRPTWRAVLVFALVVCLAMGLVALGMMIGRRSLTGAVLTPAAQIRGANAPTPGMVAVKPVRPSVVPSARSLWPRSHTAPAAHAARGGDAPSFAGVGHRVPGSGPGGTGAVGFGSWTPVSPATLGPQAGAALLTYRRTVTRRQRSVTTVTLTCPHCTTPTSFTVERTRR